MQARLLCSDGAVLHERAVLAEVPDCTDSAWAWLDLDVAAADVDAVTALLAPFELDPIAVTDAVTDTDAPKFDDFGSHVLIVLHGLRDDALATYEVDAFLTDQMLITIHRGRSPSIDALWNRCGSGGESPDGGIDELLCRLADVLTRRLLSVVEVFDDRIDHLVDAALAADPELLEVLTAVRSDIASVRRIAHPQREALDAARRSESHLLTPGGHRRFADTFDVATRVGHGLDAARASLSETLEAYRGAEARKATEVSRILTIYAAIMLPLSLVVGFFGMNFDELPLVDRSNGWIIVSVAMGAIAILSLGLFIGAGWMRRPSGRSATRALAKGLLEAALAPVEIVGSLFEVPGEAARSATHRLRRRRASEGDR